MVHRNKYQETQLCPVQNFNKLSFRGLPKDGRAYLWCWFQCLESNQLLLSDTEEAGQMVCLSNLTEKAEKEAQKEPENEGHQNEQ